MNRFKNQLGSASVILQKVVGAKNLLSAWLSLTAGSAAMGDTCITWVRRIDVGTPGKRISPAMAYDSDRGVTVFFGGEYSDAGSSTITYYNDTWEYDGTSWTETIYPFGGGPDPRSGHTLVYDTVHKQVVLFGGVNEKGYLNDTWVYHPRQGSSSPNWERKADLVNPLALWTFFEFNARAGHAMAFDSLNGLAVMSGGTGAETSTSDQLVNGYPPTYRSAEAFEWDGTNWYSCFTKISLRYPRGGANYWANTFTRHAMAFDSKRGVVLQAGGTAYLYQPSGTDWADWELDDVLSIDTTNCASTVSHNAGLLVHARQQFAMVYDSSRDKFVVFGGVVDPSLLWANPGASHEELGFDPAYGEYRSTELMIPTPPARARHAMVYDSKRQVTVLFGGVSGDARYDDTWELTKVRPQFVGDSPTNQEVEVCSVASFEVVVNGDAPQTFQWLKDGQPLIDDGRFSQVTSNFGPFILNVLTIQDTRVTDRGCYSVVVAGACGTNTSHCASMTVVQPWTLIATNGPSPRTQHAMAYDLGRGITVLFGGADNAGLYGDTWEWNGITWALRATSGPLPRAGASMVYDRAIGKILLVGGNVGDSRNPYDPLHGFRAETWCWDGWTWTLLATNGPSGRIFGAITFDSVANRTVFWGGFGLIGPFVPDVPGVRQDQLQDTWEYDARAGVWTQVVDGGGPYNNYGPALVYDEFRNKRVLMTSGSRPVEDGNATRVWEWEGANWVQKWPGAPPAGAPVHLFDESYAYHPKLHLVVLNNGNNQYGLPQETWGYDGTNWILLSHYSGFHPESHEQMVYDTARDAMVVFGGEAPRYLSGQTWEWAYSDQVKILQPPADAVVASNQLVQLSVIARGAPLLVYQWRKDGKNLVDGPGISGTTNGLLTITNANPVTDAGVYDVVVGNKCGSVVSSPAALSFGPSSSQLGAKVTPGGLVLQWTSPVAVLESAPALSGPFTLVLGASSPFTVVPAGPNRFFRLRLQ